MHPLRKDPWVAAQIEKGLQAHKDALTPAQLEALREQMAHTFATHPAAQRVLERWRPTESTSGRGTGKPPTAESPDKKEGKP